MAAKQPETKLTLAQIVELISEVGPDIWSVVMRLIQLLKQKPVMGTKQSCSDCICECMDCAVQHQLEALACLVHARAHCGDDCCDK